MWLALCGGVVLVCGCAFIFSATATTEIYTYWHTLSLHDALPISQDQVARRVMIPFDAPLLPIDSEAQAVALAGGDLRGGQHAGHLAVEVQQDVAIVVQLAPRNDAGQIEIGRAHV